MRIGKVPEYVLQNHGLKVSRQTIYNWINVGVQGVKLAVSGGTHRYFGPQDVTPEAINDFIAATNIGGR